MAREEQDREDLLREATALEPRIELRVEGFEEPVTAGFRRGGEALSLFFGQDPVLQFTSAGALRRGYCRGELLKAEKRALIAMRRVRTEKETRLESRTLSGAVGGGLLAEFESLLERLQTALERGEVEVLGQVPAESRALARLQSWLAARPKPIPLAESPRVQ